MQKIIIVDKDHRCPHLDAVGCCYSAADGFGKRECRGPEHPDCPLNCLNVRDVWNMLNDAIMSLARSMSNKYRTYTGWTISDGVVIVWWTESWSYGGHDEGCVELPWAEVLKELEKGRK